VFGIFGSRPLVAPLGIQALGERESFRFLCRTLSAMELDRRDFCDRRLSRRVGSP
jgi:hypothetical protein